MDTLASPPSAGLIDRVLAIIAKEGMVEREKLTLDAPLDSLGLVSADLVVILLAIEEEFNVYVPVDSELSEAKTLGDLVTALVDHIATKPAAN